MINEFRYGQIWKICPSPLSLSLYSTFKSVLVENNSTEINTPYFLPRTSEYVLKCSEYSSIIPSMFEKIGPAFSSENS